MLEGLVLGLEALDDYELVLVEEFGVLLVGEAEEA